MLLIYEAMSGNTQNGIKIGMHFSNSGNLNVKEKLEILNETNQSIKQFCKDIHTDLQMSKWNDILKKKIANRLSKIKTKYQGYKIFDLFSADGYTFSFIFIK